MVTHESVIHIELLGQPKLQKGGEKNKRKPIWLGSSGDNLRSTGEYIGHNFLNWKEPRIPSSSPPSIPNQISICNLLMISKFVALVCALPSHQLLNCRSFKFCKRKLGNMGKTKHYGTKMEFAGLPPSLVCFFRPQTVSRMVDRFFTQPVCVLHASIFESAKSEKVSLAGFAGHSWLLDSLGVPHSGG